MWDEYWFRISAIWLCPAYVTAHVFVWCTVSSEEKHAQHSIDEISSNLKKHICNIGQICQTSLACKKWPVIIGYPKAVRSGPALSVSLFRSHTNSHMHTSSVPVPSKHNEPPPRASTLLKVIAISSLHPHKGKIWFACGSTHWSISKPFMQK